MATMAEFRAQYPMYADIPDGELRAMLAQRGIQIEAPPPAEPGILSRLGTTVARGMDEFGAQNYRALERAAMGLGWEEMAAGARSRRESREAALQESAGRALPNPPGVAELWEDPSRIFSAQTGLGILGMIANSGAQIPTFFSPVGLAGQVGQFTGNNLQEQMEARGIPLEDTNLLTAGATGVAQTALGRILGPEALVGRRMAGEALTGGLGRRVARQAGIGAVGEAIEEGAQEAMQIAQGDLSRVGERFADPRNQLRVADSALYGGLSGGILSGGIAAVSPGRPAETPLPPMTMEEAIGILQRATPVQPTTTVQGGPNIPGVMGDAMRAPAVSLSPELAQAIQNGDAYEREIAMAAIPEEQRINALNLYRQARDNRASNLRSGIEVPPGGVVSPSDPRTEAPAALPAPPPALAAPEAPREAARSPVDDLVATMTPEGEQTETAAAPQGSPPAAQAEAPPPEAAQPAPAQPAPAPDAPSPEDVQRAEAVIQQATAKMIQRGAQGKRAADAALAFLQEGRQRTEADPEEFRYDPRQIAAAFEAAEVLAEISPQHLGQAVEFVGNIVSRKTGQEIQGTQQRDISMSEDGLMGLIRLSMDPTYTEFARETAAHEGMHAIWDWFRKTDPKVFRALQAAYPTEADGTVQLNRIDNSILRLLKRNLRPDGQSYYDYLMEGEYGTGTPGVFPNQDEANAYTFGAIYELTKEGKPANSLKPLLLRAFNFFSDMMDRLRASPNRRLLEDVATGRFRQREGDRQADISVEGLAETAPDAAQQEPAGERQSGRTQEPAPAAEPAPQAQEDAPQPAQEQAAAQLLPDAELQARGVPSSDWGRVRAAEIMGSMPEALLDARSRANRFVRALLDTPETRKPNVPLRDLLRGIEAELPPAYKPLLNVIRASTPAAMPVYGPGHPVGRNYKDAAGNNHSYDSVRMGSSYVFTPMNIRSGLINLDFAEMERFGVGPAHVVLHEALHAATMAQLQSLEQQAARGYGNAREVLSALDAMRSAAMERAAEAGMEFERLGAGRLAYVINADGVNYDTVQQKTASGRAEFIAEAFTSPQFQAFLSEVETTPEVRRALEAAGIQSQPRTMLQAMLDWLRSTLNLNQGSVLDDVFSLAPHVFNGPVALDTELRPETVRESARNLPPDLDAAYKKLVSQEAAGWMGRKLSHKPWIAGMRAKLAADLRRSLVDKYNDIEDMERRLTGRNRLSAEVSGYVALWQAEDVERFMDAELRYGGRTEFVQDPVNPGASYFRTSRDTDGGMKWLEDFVRTGKDAADIDNMMKAFQVYAIAKRGTNLNTQGILNQVGPADRAAAATALREYPQIAAAYAGYQRSNQKLMELMVETGVLDPKDAAAFLKHNDYYPFYRAIPETATGEIRRIAGIGSKFKPKEIEGGNQKFMDDPMQVILNNRAYWLHSAMMNVAKSKVVDTGRRLGVIKPFDPKTDKDGGRINLRVKGKNYVFHTSDPNLTMALEAYNGLDESWKSFLSVAGAPSRMLREFVTKNPTFMLYSNLIRDSLSGWQASGANIIPIASTAKGIMDYYSDDPQVRRYIELGHGGRNQSTEDSAFRNAGDLLVDSIRIEAGVYRATTGGMLLDILKKGYSKLNNLSEASDLATRVAIFKAELERTGNEAEAAWRAREIMNFTKHGRAQWLRILAGLIPFTNARIQGMDVMIQNLSGKRTGDPVKTRNEKLGQAWFRGGLMMGAAIAIAAAFDDDDEIKQQPRWLRDTNLLIPLRAIGLADQGVLAIPKPFEYGTLFMTIPEYVFRVMRGTETTNAAVGNSASAIMASMQYIPIPTAALPFIEQVANYSFFTGRPIVGGSLEGLNPELRATRATPGIYTDLAKGVADFFTSMGMNTPGVFAPVRMDHFVRSWTGTIGTYFATAVGTLAGSEDMRGWSIDRAPIVSAAIRNERNTPPGGVDELYRLIEASDRVTRTIRTYAQAGDERRARELREANAGLVNARAEINALKARATRVSQRRREIMRDTRLTAEQKRAQLDALDQALREITVSVERLRIQAGQ